MDPAVDHAIVAAFDLGMIFVAGDEQKSVSEREDIPGRNSRGHAVTCYLAAIVDGVPKD